MQFHSSQLFKPTDCKDTRRNNNDRQELNDGGLQSDHLHALEDSNEDSEESQIEESDAEEEEYVNIGVKHSETYKDKNEHSEPEECESEASESKRGNPNNSELHLLFIMVLTLIQTKKHAIRAKNNTKRRHVEDDNDETQVLVSTYFNCTFHTFLFILRPNGLSPL